MSSIPPIHPHTHTQTHTVYGLFFFSLFLRSTGKTCSDGCAYLGNNFGHEVFADFRRELGHKLGDGAKVHGGNLGGNVSDASVGGLCNGGHDEEVVDNKRKRG